MELVEKEERMKMGPKVRCRAENKNLAEAGAKNKERSAGSHLTLSPRWRE
jgi:hypothetical protein